MNRSADDDLRARLSRLDPAGPYFPVDPLTSPRAAELMERAMRSADLASPVDLPPTRSSRRPVVWLAAAAAATAATVGIIVVAGDDAGSGRHDRQTTLTLSLPASDVMSSCLPFEVTYLREMPMAFAGTVIVADGEQVVVDVTRWYRGGDADLVALDVPIGQTSAALDGVDFRSGQHYFLTATSGTVNGCGYSGPATSELEDAYDEAFGS